MKKFLLILTLGAIAALYGCAEEKEEDNALVPVNPENPASLVGSYDITYYGLEDNGRVVTNDCKKYKPVDGDNTWKDKCKQSTDQLHKKAYIQSHEENGKTIYSFVAQVQQYTNPEDMKPVANDPGKESFYYHILAAFNANHINGTSGVDTRSKATVRGLTDFFVKPVYGNTDATNVTINKIGFADDNKSLMIVVQSDNKTHRYTFEMKKISNDSGDYVIKRDIGPQGGNYAYSKLLNKLPKTKFVNNIYESFVKDFIKFEDKK